MIDIESPVGREARGWLAPAPCGVCAAVLAGLKIAEPEVEVDAVGPVGQVSEQLAVRTDPGDVMAVSRVRRQGGKILGACRSRFDSCVEVDQVELMPLVATEVDLDHRRVARRARNGRCRQARSGPSLGVARSAGMSS